MAARRNIVPAAEISIATVVDPSSLLFSLFFSFSRISLFSLLFLVSLCLILFLTLLEKSERDREEKQRLLTRPSESANWARLISRVTSRARWMFGANDVVNKFEGFRV